MFVFCLRYQVFCLRYQVFFQEGFVPSTCKGLDFCLQSGAGLFGLEALALRQNWVVAFVAPAVPFRFLIHGLICNLGTCGMRCTYFLAWPTSLHKSRRVHKKKNINQKKERRGRQ